MSNRSTSFRSQTDSILGFGLGLLTAITGTLALFILGFLAWQSWPAFSEVGLERMFSDPKWLPRNDAAPQFQITTMLAGTFLVAVGATCWAAPVGLLTAIYARLFAPVWVAQPLNRLIELLAGVPSVVFGFWGLVCVVPLISAWQSVGNSLLAGIIVLGLMIIPTMVLTCRSAFESVADSQVLAAHALGLSRFSLFRAAILPAAFRGILAGGVLAITRAIGETMAVLMVCGNIAQFPRSILDPVRTITSNIAMEMGDAAGLHQSMLFATGLVLLLVVSLIVLLFQYRLQRPGY